MRLINQWELCQSENTDRKLRIRSLLQKFRYCSSDMESFRKVRLKFGRFWASSAAPAAHVHCAMVSPVSPSTRTDNGELSEYGRYALVVCYAIALPVGKDRLPKGVGKALEAAFGVSKGYPSRLWSKAAEQLSAGHTLCFSNAARSGRRTTLTPSKRQRILDINAENRTLTVRALTAELAERDVKVTPSAVQQWLTAMEAQAVPVRITPSLSFEHRRARVDFIVDQATKMRRNFRAGFNTVHIDESWFYLIRMGAKVRMFPGEGKVGSVKLRHKSHVPKVMFICAVSRPDPDHNFDGKIGIWRVSKVKEAERNSKGHERGGFYEVDCTADAEWYGNWYTDVFLPAVREKMPWLEGQEVIAQQDGASPHTGKGNPQRLNEAGKEGGWNIKLVTQPAQSPDLNINDLGFFCSLKSRVWQRRFETLEDMARGVKVMFDEYDAQTLERMWQSLFKRYNQVSGALGKNDFEVVHAQTEQKQKTGILENEVKIDTEAFDRAADWWCTAEESDDKDWF